MECFCWSTVSADYTPLINAGMVFCDRHFGGINYPKGGVGRIAMNLAEGFEELGGQIIYRANVKQIVTEPQLDGKRRAVAVELADGRVFRSASTEMHTTSFCGWLVVERSFPMPLDGIPSRK